VQVCVNYSSQSLSSTDLLQQCRLHQKQSRSAAARDSVRTVRDAKANSKSLCAPRHHHYYHPYQTQDAARPDISPVVGDQPAVSTVSNESGSTITALSELSRDSRLALFRALLDSATPSLVKLFPVITDAGLSTDAHLEQYYRMLPMSRDKFIREVLSDKSTLFEKVAVIEILERMNQAGSTGSHNMSM